MNIKKICNQIDLLIAGEIDEIDNKSVYFYLSSLQEKKVNEDKLALICDTMVKIATTKNRKLRRVEKIFWNFVTEVPFWLDMEQQPDGDNLPELLADSYYQEPGKRICSKLVGLAFEILGLKGDSSKGTELRRVGSLNLITELTHYYDIPEAKPLFMEWVRIKNNAEQYAALEGLENFYAVFEDDIEDDFVRFLSEILAETTDRSVASTCLQILINAGIISKGTALWEMDSWKERHFR